MLRAERNTRGAPDVTRKTSPEGTLGAPGEGDRGYLVGAQMVSGRRRGCLGVTKKGDWMEQIRHRGGSTEGAWGTQRVNGGHRGYLEGQRGCLGEHSGCLEG